MSSRSIMRKNLRPLIIKLEPGHDITPKRERDAELPQQQQHKLQRCCIDGPEAAAAVAAAAVASLASGRCSLAAAQLQEALLLGHLSSRASLAWMLVFGRQGVAKNRSRAFELAEKGARLGCHDCQGMVSLCRALGYGCAKNAALALRLARESALAGSK